MRGVGSDPHSYRDRSRASHLNAADGVVAQDRKSLVEVGPPPRPLHQRKLRDIFLNVAATPPVQEGQWIAFNLANELPTQDF